MLSRNLFELAATGKHILDFSPTGLVLYACQSWAVRSKVLQIANPQTCGFKQFLDLRTFRIYGTLRFSEPIFSEICVFVHWFCDLQTLKNLIAHL
jgi:hypothetical protein